MICFFRGTAQGARHEVFKVLAFGTDNQSVVRCVSHHDEWRDFDFGLFSVATSCGDCKNFASTTFSLA
jgi:hypothetical protein